MPGTKTLSTVEREVKIVNKYGLHARPAMQLVEVANKYNSNVEVSKDALTVDAKSIMSIMRLAATKDSVLRIRAEGDDAEQAVEEMAEIVANGFGEMDEE